MGNITISLEKKDEERLRKLARERYESKKGSLSKIVSEGIAKIERESKKERSKASLLRKLENGFDMGKILYRKRSELHER